MVTWQHIERAKEFMTALAVVEQRGQRSTAQHAVDQARKVAAELCAEGSVTSALEILALQLRDCQRNPQDAFMGVYWMAALAIELGLEADETAQREARDLLARVSPAAAPTTAPTTAKEG